MLGWQLLKSFKTPSSFSLPFVQINKTSSIYQNHTQGFNFCASRKLVSISSIKMEVYVGANLVPMAVHDIWCLTSPLNSK